MELELNVQRLVVVTKKLHLEFFLMFNLCTIHILTLGLKYGIRIFKSTFFA